MMYLQCRDGRARLLDLPEDSVWVESLRPIMVLKVDPVDPSSFGAKFVRRVAEELEHAQVAQFSAARLPARCPQGCAYADVLPFQVRPYLAVDKEFLH